jgi:hypothetical protein
MAGCGCEILRQVSLDRTAKTWLKMLVYQDYQANYLSAFSPFVSNFYQFQPFSAFSLS